MNETFITPPVITSRLIKHGDKVVSIPVGSPITVDNIFINDLQGFDSIISSIIVEKKNSGIISAMKLLGSYKFFYNLTDKQIKEFAYLTGIVAPYDSDKLTQIETDIYNIIFPKFTLKHQDLTELTKSNWIDFKIDILRKYIKKGVNDSNHDALKKLNNTTNKSTFVQNVNNLISEKSFDSSVKFNPFIGFMTNNLKPKKGDTLIISTGGTKVKDNNDTDFIEIGEQYLYEDPNEISLDQPLRLNKHLASLLVYVDSVLNKCILNYINKNNMSYLDEYKETSFTDGNKKKSSPKKSKKKSKKNKKKTLK
jgi:hypothetical protein